jgi:PAS domain S-box-containing protein
MDNCAPVPALHTDVSSYPGGSWSTDTRASFPGEIQGDQRDSGNDPCTPSLMETLLDAAPDGISMIDEAGILRFVNLKMQEIFGYPREDLIGRSIEELVPQSFGSFCQEASGGTRETRHSSRSTQSDTPWMAVRADGSRFLVEMSLSPAFTELGLWAVAIIRPHTAKRSFSVVMARRDMTNSQDPFHHAVDHIDPSNSREMEEN